MIVHGLPGVGKDTTVAQSLLEERVAACSRVTLAAWLHGSTNDSLRRDLLQVFRTHRPQVLRGMASEKEEAQFEAVRAWMANNPGWFFVVEDAPQDACLESLFPPSGDDVASRCGRLLVTSKSGLEHLGTTYERLRLEPLGTEDCLTILRSMQAFNRFGEARWEACAKSDAVPDEDAMQSECKAAEVEYVVPAPNLTNAKRIKEDRQKRYRKMWTDMEQKRQLESSIMRELVEDTLGNLPLSVRLCGHLLRSGDSLQSG